MSDIHRTIEAVWKIESTRLIAAIARDLEWQQQQLADALEQALLADRLKQIEKTAFSAQQP